jgi:hypothetical protein
MTRENLISEIIKDVATEFRFSDLTEIIDSGAVEFVIDEMLLYFKSRTCENCKFLDVGPYDVCPIVEPLSRQYLDYDESTFSCNSWKPKDE